jgi:cyclopropane fatty-acyl-phospholipid synthase-like methyltransferase
MTFALSRDAYDRYMGRYSDRLASAFIDFAGVRPGMRALDVGCGPGALTEALAGRVGPAAVAAADPSESLLAAYPDRVPGADVRHEQHGRHRRSNEAKKCQEPACRWTEFDHVSRSAFA